MIDTRENIKKSAKFLFERYSPKKVSIDMIVQEAGIGKGTFYNYFSNKASLYEEIVHSFVDELTEEEYRTHDKTSLLKEILIGSLELAQSEPIIKNFFLKNQNFFLGTINYDYLKREHKNCLKKMTKKILPNIDNALLSDIVWMYTKEMIITADSAQPLDKELFAELFIHGFLHITTA